MERQNKPPSNTSDEFERNVGINSSKPFGVAKHAASKCEMSDFPFRQGDVCSVFVFLFCKKCFFIRVIYFLSLFCFVITMPQSFAQDIPPSSKHFQPQVSNWQCSFLAATTVFVCRCGCVCVCVCAHLATHYVIFPRLLNFYLTLHVALITLWGFPKEEKKYVEEKEEEKQEDVNGIAFKRFILLCCCSFQFVVLIGALTICRPICETNGVLVTESLHIN